MCAIIGVVGRIPERDAFTNARDTMAHRGPDGEGLYYSEKESIALGHRRLSVIDLSARALQPFESFDGRFKLIFNGEIYNYKELKQQLRGFYPFKTTSDTEVLLAAFMKWREGALPKLNGMFSFAVWDSRQQELFLARDRFGVKPLYYTHRNGTFYFSSEVKGLLALLPEKRKLVRQSLFDYLAYRYPLGEATFFEGIKNFPPASYLYFRGDKQSIAPVRYWRLPIVARKKDTSEKEAISRTKELLFDAIKLRTRSDVPFGAYLSGGLDSSVIVAAMAGFSREPILTFCARFNEKAFDEGLYAKKVARLFGTKHYEVNLDAETYLEALPHVIKIKDAPLLSTNEVAWHLLSRKLKKHITVVLSGNGADELFGGYGRIIRSGLDYDRMRLLEAGKVSKDNRKTLQIHLEKKYGKVRFKTVTDHFLAQYPYLSPETSRKFLNKGMFHASKNLLLNKNFFREFFVPLEKLSTEDQYLYFFQHVHLLGTLMHFDSVTMAYSVEGREPYVDYRLVEYVSGLPFKYKIPWKGRDDEIKSQALNADEISEVHDVPKYLLKQIAKEFLPEEIVHRKKLGFPAPMNSWLFGKSKTFVRETLLSRDAATRDIFDQNSIRRLLGKGESFGEKRGIYLWNLLNLELWMKAYKVTL